MHIALVVYVPEDIHDSVVRCQEKNAAHRHPKHEPFRKTLRPDQEPEHDRDEHAQAGHSHQDESHKRLEHRQRREDQHPDSVPGKLAAKRAAAIPLGFFSFLKSSSHAALFAAF